MPSNKSFVIHHKRDDNLGAIGPFFLLIPMVLGLGIPGCAEKEPESEAMKELKDATEDLGEAAGEFGEAAGDAAQELGEAARDKAEELVEEGAAKAEELVDEAKEHLSDEQKTE